MLIQAIWNNHIIAETEHFIFVGGNYYFPPDSINKEYIRSSNHKTNCPWKGDASYFHIKIDGQINENAVWYYPDPKPGFTHIKNYCSFWNGVEIHHQHDGKLHKDVSKKIAPNLLRFLLEVPKTEIHIHLEAIASIESIYRLIQKNKINLEGIDSREDLQDRFRINDLNEFIDLYINILQPCICDESDLMYYLNDLSNYVYRNQIYYAEIFFAPSTFLKRGLEFPLIVDVLKNKTMELEKRGYKIRFLVDVSRSFGPENAMKNLDLTLAHREDCIIGIGLGGAEKSGPARDYKEVFKKARANGLRVVAHAGEDVGPQSVWDAIHLLKVERIGHGISASLDDSLQDYLKEHQIPLEICPTSNVFTKKFVASLNDHPIREFYDKGLYITLNTDDPTIFGVDLVDEYANLIQHLHFNIDEIISLIKNNLMATFMSNEEKEEHWSNVEKRINELRRQLDL